MVYGLYDTQGYDSLQTQQYFVFAEQMDGGSPAPPQNGNMVFSNGYGTPQAREASARFIVSQGPLTDTRLALRFQDNGVFVYEDGGPLPRVQPTGSTLEALGPDRLRLTGQGPFKVSDQWYPGWNAYAGGQAVPITQGPYVFRTVAAPGGSVEMRYEPTAFRVGLYLLCLALGIATAFGAAAVTGTLRRRD